MAVTVKTDIQGLPVMNALPQAIFKMTTVIAFYTVTQHIRAIFAINVLLDTQKQQINQKAQVSQRPLIVNSTSFVPKIKRDVYTLYVITTPIAVLIKSVMKYITYAFSNVKKGKSSSMVNVLRLVQREFPGAHAMDLAQSVTMEMCI